MYDHFVLCAAASTGIGEICLVSVHGKGCDDQASRVNVQAKADFTLNVFLFINVYMNFVRIIMVISRSIAFQ